MVKRFISRLLIGVLMASQLALPAYAEAPMEVGTPNPEVTTVVMAPAQTEGLINKILTVTPGTSFTLDSAPVLKLRQIDGAFQNPDQYFRIRLEGAEFLVSEISAQLNSYFIEHAYSAEVIEATPNGLILKWVVPTGSPTTLPELSIPLLCLFPTEGTAAMSIDSMDSEITQQDGLTLANCRQWGLRASVNDVAEFQSMQCTVEDLVIEELVSAPAGQSGELQLNLPDGFHWISDPSIQTTGGIDAQCHIASPQTLTLHYEKTGERRGSINLSSARIGADASAASGPVILHFIGGNLEGAELRVADFQTAGIQNITLENFSLEPAFSPEVLSYSATVPEDCGFVALRIEQINTAMRVTLNRIPVNPSLIPLSAGENLIEIRAYSPNLDKTYKVHIFRQLERDITVTAMSQLALAGPSLVGTLPTIKFSGNYHDAFTSSSPGTPLMILEVPNDYMRFAHGSIMPPNTVRAELSSDGRQILVYSVPVLNAYDLDNPSGVLEGFTLKVDPTAPSMDLTLDVKIQTRDIQRKQSLTIGRYEAPDQPLAPINQFYATYYNKDNPGVPVATEVVDRVSANFSFEDSHGIPSEKFVGHWIGLLDASPGDPFQVFSIAQSWGHTKVLLDGEVVYDLENQNASIALGLLPGIHTIEVFYESNYFSTDFLMNVFPYEAEVSIDDAAAQLEPLLTEDTLLYHAGVYESTRFDHTLDLELLDTDKPVVIVATSYDPVIWKINNPNNVNIKAVVLYSYAPGSEVEGADEALLLRCRDLSFYYEYEPEMLKALTAHAINGYSCTYSSSEMNLPASTPEPEPQYGTTVQHGPAVRFDANGYAYLSPIDIVENCAGSILPGRKITLEILNPKGYTFASDSAAVEFRQGLDGTLSEAPFQSGTKQEILITSPSTGAPGDILLSGIRIKAAPNAPLETLQLAVHGKALTGYTVIQAALNNGSLKPGARTEAWVQRVRQAVPGYSFSTGYPGAVGYAPTLELTKLADATLVGPQRFQMVLSNAVWQQEITTVLGAAAPEATFTRIDDRTLLVEWDPAATQTLQLPMAVVTGKPGFSSVTLKPLKSGITQQTVRIAEVVRPSTQSTVSGDGTTALGLGENAFEFTLTENAPNAFTNEITLMLPKGFVWSNASLSGSGIPQGAIVDVSADDRLLRITLSENLAFREDLEQVVLSAAVVPKSKTKSGAVTVAVSGSGLAKETLTLGTFNRPAASAAVTTQNVAVLQTGETLLGNLLITEAEPHAMKFFETNRIQLTLPQGYTWSSTGNATVVAEGMVAQLQANGRILTVSIEYAGNYPENAQQLVLEALKIKGPKKKATAPVSVKVEGPGVVTKTLVVANPAP